MSANSKKHKKSNRKRQRRQQNKTKGIKFMKTDEVNMENDSIGRLNIQLSDSFKDHSINNEQGHQEFDESLIMNSKSLVKDLNNVESKDQTFINAIQQMSNMI